MRAWFTSRRACRVDPHAGPEREYCMHLRKTHAPQIALFPRTDPGVTMGPCVWCGFDGFKHGRNLHVPIPRWKDPNKRKTVIRSDGLATAGDRLNTWADCTVGLCKMHTVRVNLVRDLRDPPHCAVSVLQRFKSIPTGSQDNEAQFADSRDLNLQTPQRIGKSPHVTCLPGRH